MDIKHRVDLYKLLPDVNKAQVAILGVAEGLDSADMLAWGIGKLYMVDVWEQTTLPGDSSNAQPWHTSNYEQAVERVKKYGDKAVILRGYTTKMNQHVPDNSLDMVYIDACHSYECVKADIEAWVPKLKAGGIVALHDYESSEYGVKQAVTEYARSKGLTVNLIPENKPADAGAWFRI